MQLFTMRKFITRFEELSEDLRSRIHMPGLIPDSYKYLKAFDLYVLPSYEECFSLSLLDAQLAGLVVVGSQSGGTPEIVREGETGFLFEAENAASLESKLREAFGTQNQWNQFGEQARRRVIKEFDQKNIFDSILKEYEA